MIWGTVLTTLFSNLLVPGRLRLPRAGDPAATYLTRTLAPPLAGAAALLAAAWACHALLSPVPRGTAPLAVRSPCWPT